MMVRNEADRHLKRTLECVKKIPNSILVVTDDASDDDTAQICRDYGAIVQVNERPMFWANEGAARQAHYDFSTVRATAGDWVLAIDGDETISNPEMAWEIVQAADRGGYAAVGLPLYEFWTETQYRTDGFWFGTTASRLYKWKREGQIADKEMGCGSEPTYVQAALKLGANLYKQNALHLLHWGYLNPDDRVRKHQAYTERLGGHGHNNAHVASIVTEPTLADYQGALT